MVLKIVATFAFVGSAEIALNRVKNNFPNLIKASIRGNGLDVEDDISLVGFAFSGLATNLGNNLGYNSSFPYPYSRRFLYDNDNLNETNLKDECKVEVVTTKEDFKPIKSMLLNMGGYDFLEVIDNTK